MGALSQGHDSVPHIHKINKYNLFFFKRPHSYHANSFYPYFDIISDADLLEHNVVWYGVTRFLSFSVYLLETKGLLM